MADGSRIRELRTRRGLLQRELAEMAGVTESAVRNYELGLRTPLLVTPDCSHCERKRAFSRSFR